MEQGSTSGVSSVKPRVLVVLMINSARHYYHRRRAIRRSYLRYLDSDSPVRVSTQQIIYKFCVGRKKSGDKEDIEDECDKEAQKHGDIIQVDVEETYDNFAWKIVHFMKWAEDHFDFDFFFHADDDSFLRLDLLLPLLDTKPRQLFYWGYMWNTGLRITRPIRDPKAKSYMPYDQVPKDDPYPPFASGCGFVMTTDLVHYLVENIHKLPHIRLDVALGIWILDFPDYKNIIFENEPRIRPYRALPLFDANTLVQHYMYPEEYVPFWKKAVGLEPTDAATSDAPAQLYSLLASMGLMKK